MAKKKETAFVPVPAGKRLTAEETEAIRKHNFPNNPPPTLRQLKAMKNNRSRK